MSKGTVVSLFDYSGVMVQPWLEDGYDAVIVDVKHKDTEEIVHGQSYYKLHANLIKPIHIGYALRGLDDDIVIVFAFPPCDHLAISGARWFRGKGLRALSNSIAMFATATEYVGALGVPYCIENPMSTISTYWRKPNAVVHPYQFTKFCKDDNYTKATCLWYGNGFALPPFARDWELQEIPDNRIHTAPDMKGRKKFRSDTPEGFARAVHKANCKEP